MTEKRRGWPKFVGVAHRKMVSVQMDFSTWTKASTVEMVKAEFQGLGKGSRLFIELTQRDVDSAIEGKIISPDSGKGVYQQIAKIAHEKGMRVVGLIDQWLGNIIERALRKNKIEGALRNKRENIPEDIIYANQVVQERGMRLRLRDSSAKDIVVMHRGHLESLAVEMNIPESKLRYIGRETGKHRSREELLRIAKRRKKEKQKKRRTNKRKIGR